MSSRAIAESLESHCNNWVSFNLVNNDDFCGVDAAGVFFSECCGVGRCSEQERRRAAEQRSELQSELEWVESRRFASWGREDMAGCEESGGSEGAACALSRSFFNPEVLGSEGHGL